MKTKDFEKRMRLGECYHGLRVPPGAFIVLRVDGRAFSAMTLRLKVTKPFDVEFHVRMVETAKALFEHLGAVYAYTESDEISVVLPRDTDQFGREVEKLVSVAAGRASASMSLQLNSPVDFDGRVWVGATEVDVIDYLLWRQADAKRCCVNGWSYWTLRDKGKSPGAANAQLSRLNGPAKQDLLLQHGVYFDALPGWQRHGTGIYKNAYTKEGHNPKTGESVAVIRRKVVVEDELPTKSAYASFIRTLISANTAAEVVATELLDSGEFLGR